MLGCINNNIHRRLQALGEKGFIYFLPLSMARNTSSCAIFHKEKKFVFGNLAHRLFLYANTQFFARTPRHIIATCNASSCSFSQYSRFMNVRKAPRMDFSSFGVNSSSNA
eukprot:m.80949 g.80949  ORF g.80949 m.80949 type:complete len:110 (+) comp8638_c2_seq4:1365-1694(+)